MKKLTHKRQKIANNFLVNKKERNGWIELLRLLAITFIMFAHFRNYYKDVQPFWIEVDNGGIGVATFILISGFLNAQNTKNRTFKFLIKCLFYTLYGFVIFSILWATGSKIGIIDNPFLVFFGKWFDTKYSSWWFLYVYLAFTLLMPFINMFIHKTNKYVSLGVIIVVFLCNMPLLVSSPTRDHMWHFVTFTKLLLFIWVYGVGAWFGYYQKEKINKASNKKWIWLSIAAAAAIALMFSRPSITGKLCQVPGATIVCVEIFGNIIYTCVGLIWVIFFDNLPTIKVKGLNKTFLFLGKTSLALYLYHGVTWIVMDMFYPGNPTSYSVQYYAVKFIVYWLVAFAVASLLCLFIDVQEKFFWKKYYQIKAKRAKKIENK